MKDKKMERIILSIALIILLCSYYLTPSSRINYKTRKAENKTGFSLNKSDDTHNPIQSVNIPFNSTTYKTTIIIDSF